ncbi:ABC transporter permease [Beijerinckia indica]|uniref:Binding-protein-dependent transport systems inner membrane component n=1 Tax=Beijerinckia indica subsp. indica (strain ATCC 9039 / DSM 1715 / NCIMB 8712) TaxID=395963 RepID=B2IF12_BEII9|nr:ABC transporter permease [Beijerinckia indica]ACB94203.1 binding-protein-dependent transport systems inner membrane component [Beijerinckia indica subsp. indica ATCC 9039]
MSVHFAAPTLPTRASILLARRLVLPLLVLLVWETASHLELVSPKLLPPLETLVKRGGEEFAQGRLPRDIAASLTRDLLGFALGAMLGTSLGILLGLSSLLRHLIKPTFDALKQIAIFAWIPLVSVWFGIGEAAKIAFIAIAAFTPCLVNTLTGMAGIPRPYIEVAKVLDFSPWSFLTRLAIPAALPSIFTGLHLGLIHSWLATIGAEYFMTAGPGIGGMMIAGREQFEMDLVLLGVILLASIGVLLNNAALHVETYVLSWRKTSAQ